MTRLNINILQKMKLLIIHKPQNRKENMEASRITFTEETRKKIMRKLSTRERGKILYGRLVELEKDGTLSKAKNRSELIKLVGYPEERKSSGSSWLGGLINRGHLDEVIDGTDKNGDIKFRYYLTNNPPDYDYAKGKIHNVQTKKPTSVASVETSVKEEEVVPEVKDIGFSKAIKMELCKGELTIKVEFDDVDKACQLIVAIMKGEL